MNSPLLHIGLSSWIIQDGNYADFERGTIRRFALEFYSEAGLIRASSSHATPGLVHLRDAYHQAQGHVRFFSPEAWVVDFGDILAFREERPPDMISLDTAVAGEVYLDVDPFFYFERLRTLPGIPPLIYEWHIEDIVLETGPFISATDAVGGTFQIRDRSRAKHISVPKTDAWHDDHGHASYVLVCRRMPTSPSYRLNA